MVEKFEKIFDHLIRAFFRQKMAAGKRVLLYVRNALAPETAHVK
jgi:hypothetical protein